ncbi:hypothetical protein ADUPG1_000080 [Aduncisulcus paluster]|uniref:Uncharacterized protein n=1 Tax=Aduncisulcus paluster TaxID=2918883 RepID=A0ABQ5K4P4_9EUKA|nr:hypothetical protein ADUPG1_000080 [Aduncisulcus paluster]
MDTNAPIFYDFVFSESYSLHPLCWNLDKLSSLLFSLAIIPILALLEELMPPIEMKDANGSVVAVLNRDKTINIPLALGPLPATTEEDDFAVERFHDVMGVPISSDEEIQAAVDSLEQTFKVQVGSGSYDI